MKKIMVTCIALTLGGCAQQSMQDLHGFIAEVKARAPTPIDPIPQIKQAETFLYVADGRRSPFRKSKAQAGMSSITEAQGDGPRPDPNRRKEELEAFPLDALRMVGTLEMDPHYWGLIKTKDGTIHKVESGNYLGKNHGQIVSIDEGRISLRELVQNSAGVYRERQASLALR